MKELTLAELKDIELGILNVFDAFCRENRIRYFLCNGTLLGAVKYKKFIPWDDDIDLLIPREDYDRMISLFQDSDRYRLFAFEKNPDFRYPMAKLCDMTTYKDESPYDNGVKLGVDIDLFPLDAWDDDFERAKKEVKYIKRNMMYLGLTKVKNIEEPNFAKRMIKRILQAFCKALGSGYFVKKINRASHKSHQEGKRYLGCKAWCIYGEREIIPADVFAETIDIEFEGQQFPAPQGYDAYLTSLYGDYMPEPPKEKQKTHHTFKAYRL